MQSIELSDIFRGAYLLCSGGKVDESRLFAGQVYFVIRGEGLCAADDAYFNGNAKVNPVQFRHALNFLRDRVFEKVRKERRERSPYHGQDLGGRASRA